MQSRRTSQTKYGATPTVDLLPSGQRAELLHERVMGRLLIAIVVSAVIAGLIAAVGILPERIANERLRAAEATSQQLLTSIAEQAEVQSAINDSQTLNRIQRQLTEREVLFASLVNEVADRLPQSMSVTSFSGTVPTGDDIGSLCTADAASLTVVVEGPDLGQGADYTERLQTMTGFTCLLASQIDASGEGSNPSLTLQIALNEEAFSNRFSEVTE